MLLHHIITRLAGMISHKLIVIQSLPFAVCNHVIIVLWISNIAKDWLIQANGSPILSLSIHRNTSRKKQSWYSMQKAKTMINRQQVLNMFTYHPPYGESQIQRYADIREHGLYFAEFINETVPDSHEKNMAIDSIRNAVMWANASIACNESPIEVDGSTQLGVVSGYRLPGGSQ
jgi:hypothetical protein